MYHKLLFIFVLQLVYSETFCQNNWEFYVGPSLTNVLHTIEGQQVTYSFELNAPLWNYGFQSGINREITFNSSIYYSAGLGIKLGGDKKSRYLIFPSEKLTGIRILYLYSPLSVKLKLIKTKNYYIKTGISIDYLLLQKKDFGVPYFPEIHSFKDKIGLNGHIGFIFKLSKKLNFEILYSEGITNIFNHTPSGSSAQYGYRNQAFEFNLILQ